MGEDEITNKTEALEAIDAVIDKLDDLGVYYAWRRALALRTWLNERDVM
jgi:hypothetical protein